MTVSLLGCKIFQHVFVLKIVFYWGFFICEKMGDSQIYSEMLKC